MKPNFDDIQVLKDEFEKGNHLALEFLMDSYHQQLCTYIFSLSNNYEQTQDVVQNVFVKFWEKRHQIQSIKSIRRFLFSAAYNEFIDLWRKNAKLYSLEEKHINALHEIFEDTSDEGLKKRINLVNKEIQKLPDRCRETLLLSKREGLTNIEIANFMNVSIRTVESQISKAFRIIRERLKRSLELKENKRFL